LFKGEKMDVKHTPETKRKAVYEDLRPLLFSIAYRMVGSASEAEDIVQEAFLRFHRESSEGTKIESPKAWLSTVTTRLAINHVESARVRRESYVGTWLPEPLLTDTESEGPRHADTADSLSMAFLVLLESLGPIERAVFLLREVFNYGYDEIATIARWTERVLSLRPARRSAAYSERLTTGSHRPSPCPRPRRGETASPPDGIRRPQRFLPHRPSRSCCLGDPAPTCSRLDEQLPLAARRN
jgi:RNA polymerase sigma factor (sigma-70 family)